MKPHRFNRVALGDVSVDLGNFSGTRFALCQKAFQRVDDEAVAMPSRRRFIETQEQLLRYLSIQLRWIALLLRPRWSAAFTKMKAQYLEI